MLTPSPRKAVTPLPSELVALGELRSKLQLPSQSPRASPKQSPTHSPRPLREELAAPSPRGRPPQGQKPFPRKQVAMATWQPEELGGRIATDVSSKRAAGTELSDPGDEASPRHIQIPTVQRVQNDESQDESESPRPTEDESASARSAEDVVGTRDVGGSQTSILKRDAPTPRGTVGASLPSQRRTSRVSFADAPTIERYDTTDYLLGVFAEAARTHSYLIKKLKDRPKSSTDMGVVGDDAPPVKNG